MRTRKTNARRRRKRSWASDLGRAAAGADPMTDGDKQGTAPCGTASAGMGCGMDGHVGNWRVPPVD